MEICLKYDGHKVHLASTHHPQTNGLTERMNRTLINLIKKVTHQHPHTWDNMLPLFEFAYNQTPNSTTGIPPFLANQGYLPSTPAALLAASYTTHGTFKTYCRICDNTFAKLLLRCIYKFVRRRKKKKHKFKNVKMPKRGSHNFKLVTRYSCTGHHFKYIQRHHANKDYATKGHS